MPYSSIARGHRFYSLMFKEPGTVEEDGLILEASVETVLNRAKSMLVRRVRRVTEGLMLNHRPIIYNLID